jgi:hypothetical protein
MGSSVYTAVPITAYLNKLPLKTRPDQEFDPLDSLINKVNGSLTRKKKRLGAKSMQRDLQMAYKKS